MERLLLRRVGGWWVGRWVDWEDEKTCLGGGDGCFSSRGSIRERKTMQQQQR